MTDQGQMQPEVIRFIRTVLSRDTSCSVHSCEDHYLIESLLQNLQAPVFPLLRDSQLVTQSSQVSRSHGALPVLFSVHS